MRSLIRVLFIFTLVITGTVKSQSFKLGMVTVEELADTIDPVFPEAKAVVLSRQVENHISSYINVYERIKIYTKEGYSKATVYIPYADVKKLKGASYNLVNGSIEKTKLDKDLIFEDERIAGYEFKKFTFPKVTSGSVIEFSYRAQKGTAADISMQYDIPIRSMYIKVINNTTVKCNIMQNPLAFLEVDREDAKFETVIKVSNVPALIRENYVSNMNRYRAKLTIASQGSREGFKGKGFGDFGKLLMKNDNFIGGFKHYKSFEPLVQEIIDDTKEERKKAELLYEYVHNVIEWNEYYGIFPDNKSSLETLKIRKGDLTDINMLYIALLRAAGITAYPTLASTRENGFPATPSVETFNYFLVCANLDGKRYLVDAAHTKARFDRLPKTVINYKALVLMDDGSVDWEIIQEPKISDKQIMANLQIDENHVIVGTAKERYTGYYAYNYSDFLEDIDDKRREAIVNYAMEGFEANDIEIRDDKAKNNVNVSYNFEIEEGIEKIGDKLYFIPLFYLAMDENQFHTENRHVPIFFNFPNRQRYNLTVKLPVGYVLEYLPTPVSLQLPDSIGQFTYNITYNETTNSLQLQANTQINRSEVDADSYFDIKEFFKRMLEKETEKVVLKKT
jgi:hypothetical protein